MKFFEIIFLLNIAVFILFKVRLVYIIHINKFIKKEKKSLKTVKINAKLAKIHLQKNIWSLIPQQKLQKYQKYIFF